MLLRTPCPVCGTVEIVGLGEDGLVTARCVCHEESSWTLVDCARDLGLRTAVRS